ncbi:hypothetical protein BKA65DRAFT_244550 [Rhexocercosporidium sp. MPI-PUGE-AT-0058]|nr:hypothetical protein BKA65DRAFT_244550 [Rhexocercosporidium sp. MPI-PUGE-AT-0058]
MVRQPARLAWSFALLLPCRLVRSTSQRQHSTTSISFVRAMIMRLRTMGSHERGAPFCPENAPLLAGVASEGCLGRSTLSCVQGQTETGDVTVRRLWDFGPDTRRGIWCGSIGPQHQERSQIEALPWQNVSICTCEQRILKSRSFLSENILFRREVGRRESEVDIGQLASGPLTGPYLLNGWIGIGLGRQLRSHLEVAPWAGDRGSQSSGGGGREGVW